MIAGIHQPQYFPWIGYFDKIDRSDVFVLLDDVPFKKNEWQNRNKIRTKDGWQWITVPVFHDFGQKIRDVALDNQARWKRKHLSAIELNYSRAPFYDKYRGVLRDMFAREWRTLSDINAHIVRVISEQLGIDTRIIVSSEINAPGEKTEHLINICSSIKADRYLSGRDGPKYMDLQAFERAGIGVEIQDFQHPSYPQRFADNSGEFVPGMSIVDLLMNCGEKSLEMIRNTRKTERG
ncbi:MAG: WbqC family protein [Candidatus Omnitrophota bacterium]